MRFFNLIKIKKYIVENKDFNQILINLFILQI